MLSRLDYYKYLFLCYGLKRGTLAMGRSWSDPAILDLSDIAWTDGIGAYPMDFSQDVTDSLLTDQRGIPIIDYANLGRHYNPWFIGHIALGLYTKYRRHHKPEDRERFRLLAEWFLENADWRSDFACWLYQFEWFGEEAGWFSGLSQAHAISVLLRAHKLMGNPEYRKIARAATDCMITEIKQGGTITREGDNTIFFQEHRKTPAAYILNGHLFSCFAAWESGRFFNEPRYQEAATAGFNYLHNNLAKFDLGFWSSYSLQKKIMGIPDIASTHYHGVHAAQLKVAGEITGNKIFQEYSNKFTNYQNQPQSARKALWLKRLAKLL